MANEGFLGKFSFGGERAATNDHPGVLLHLPLDKSASAALPVGTLMKGIDVLAASAVTGSSNSGVTSAKVNADTLKGKVSGAIGAYAFSYDGSDWKLSERRRRFRSTASRRKARPKTEIPSRLHCTWRTCFTLRIFPRTSGAEPRAIVDAPCDPTGEHGEKSALCIVHGTAKSRLLKTGTEAQPAPPKSRAGRARHIRRVVQKRPTRRNHYACISERLFPAGRHPDAQDHAHPENHGHGSVFHLPPHTSFPG